MLELLARQVPMMSQSWLSSFRLEMDWWPTCSPASSPGSPRPASGRREALGRSPEVSTPADVVKTRFMNAAGSDQVGPRGRFIPSISRQAYRGILHTGFSILRPGPGSSFPLRGRRRRRLPGSLQGHLTWCHTCEAFAARAFCSSFVGS